MAVAAGEGNSIHYTRSGDFNRSFPIFVFCFLKNKETIPAPQPREPPGTPGIGGGDWSQAGIWGVGWPAGGELICQNNGITGRFAPGLGIVPVVQWLAYAVVKVRFGARLRYERPGYRATLDTG
ncbi:MAG: hypothetical protein JXA13_10820 [Anaerolineales bacterium]|nr:hypothetical protein [Anaerolineales bacterium]